MYETKQMKNSNGVDAQHLWVNGRWQTFDMLAEGDYNEKSAPTLRKIYKAGDSFDRPLMVRKGVSNQCIKVHSAAFEPNALVPVAGWGYRNAELSADRKN